MSWTVKILGAGVTFASPTPFTAPTWEYGYDDQQPPTLCLLRRIVTLNGRFYGSENQVRTSYAALMAAIETQVATGVQLFQDTNLVLDLSNATCDDFKIESFESPESPLQWRGELLFKIKVSATVKLAGGVNVTRLMQQETWTYDEAGLLTQALTGEVVTKAGTSSAAAAKNFGLTLPGSNFGFVTNGPGGVDVHQLDRGDTLSRFTCTIKQSGGSLPSNVGPSFSVSTETAIDNAGNKITTVSASAVGTGAASAVQSVNPGGNLTSQRVSSDPYRRVASATYVQTVPVTAGPILKVWRFECKGAGRPILWTPRTGQREPLQHRGAYGPLEVSETIRIELVGQPNIQAFKIPSTMDGKGGLVEDQSKFSMSEPVRVAIGALPGGDRWVLEVHRYYYATAFGLAFRAISNFVLTPRATTGQIDAATEADGQLQGTA